MRKWILHSPCPRICQKNWWENSIAKNVLASTIKIYLQELETNVERSNWHCIFSIFRLQTEKNISVYTGLTKPIVKGSLSLIAKWFFGMSPRSDRAHLMAIKYPNAILAGDLKTCLRIFSGHFEKNVENLWIFSEIWTNWHIA